MEGLDGLVATAAYQPEPTAAAAARRFVRDTLQTWLISGATIASHGLVDDAVLLTSELVTNAVVHARTPSVMSLRLAGGVLAVTVRDGDPRPMYRPEPGATGAHDGDHGRGLLILDAMADAWGTLPTADGKVVWATMTVSST